MEVASGPCRIALGGLSFNSSFPVARMPTGRRAEPTGGASVLATPQAGEIASCPHRSSLPEERRAFLRRSTTIPKVPCSFEYGSERGRRRGGEVRWLRGSELQELGI